MYPFFKILLAAFQAKINTLEDNWILGITKDGSIPTRRYFKLKKDYDKRTKILEETIKNEESTLDEFNLEKTKRLEAETKVNELHQKLIENNSFIDTLFNMSILDGNWICTVTSAGERSSQNLSIKNGEVSLVTDDKEEHMFKVINFFYDSRRKIMSFVKVQQHKLLLPEERVSGENKQYSDHYLVNNLEYSHNLLKGFENGYRITYAKESTTIS